MKESRLIDHEAEQRRRINRYQDLVDKRYLEGLSQQETDEAEGLAHEIDRYYKPFYQPIIERLRGELPPPRGREDVSEEQAE